MNTRPRPCTDCGRVLFPNRHGAMPLHTRIPERPPRSPQATNEPYTPLPPHRSQLVWCTPQFKDGDDA